MDGFLPERAGSPGTTALIAARPTLFRLGLIGILRDHHPDWCLLQADTFHAALSLPMDRAPDVLLLDERLPDLRGIDDLQRACLIVPQVKIVILAEIDGRDRILDLIDAGAHGCLTTSASPSQVLAAFNTVLCGGLFIPATTREIIPPAPRSFGSPERSVNNLTGRQRDVFDLMVRGYSTKLMARELGLAVGTVKVHLAAIYRLLGAHNRTEAVARLVNAGLLSDQSDPDGQRVILNDLGWTP